MLPLTKNPIHLVNELKCAANNFYAEGQLVQFACALLKYKKSFLCFYRGSQMQMTIKTEKVQKNYSQENVNVFLVFYYSQK